MIKIILSGTSRSGKTRLSRELINQGYNVIPEAETLLRTKLVEEIGNEETKRWIMNNYSEFKEKVGYKIKEQEESVDAKSDEPVFFDRGANCYIAYCKLRNAKTPNILKSLAEQEKANYVFFFNGVSTFEKREQEGRFMTRDDAIKLESLIEHEYLQRGYKPGTNMIYVPEFDKNKELNIVKRLNYLTEVLKSHLVH